MTLIEQPMFALSPNCGVMVQALYWRAEYAQSCTTNPVL
jgi:hypothetical protein